MRAGTVAAAEPRADALVLDDRASGGVLPWRFFTDGVMGGVSTGAIALETVDGRAAVCLGGEVRLEYNGGFIQMALDVPAALADADPPWTGIEIDLHGNGRRYGVHLRTTALSRPWQSFRASVEAESRWQRLRLPFASFEAYRTDARFAPAQLRRVGVLAIGERFTARACVARIALVR